MKKKKDRLKGTLIGLLLEVEEVLETYECTWHVDRGKPNEYTIRLQGPLRENVAAILDLENVLDEYSETSGIKWSIAYEHINFIYVINFYQEEK